MNLVQLEGGMAGAWDDESRDGGGLPIGLGAPPIHKQIAAGVPSGASSTQAWLIVNGYEEAVRQKEAAERSRRAALAAGLPPPPRFEDFDFGDVPPPAAVPIPPARRRAFGRWLLCLAVGATAVAIWRAPSWFADADVRTRADLVMRATSSLELAPWERFASMAAPGARMNLSKANLAAAIRRAGTGSSAKDVEERTALGAAALFCMTGTSNCIERGYSAAGMSDDSRTIAHAALAFLESPAARAANADLAASQRAVLCTRLLGFRIGFTWADCNQGLDSSLGPLTAGVASEFASMRLLLLRHLLPR